MLLKHHLASLNIVFPTAGRVQIYGQWIVLMQEQVCLLLGTTCFLTQFCPLINALACTLLL